MTTASISLPLPRHRVPFFRRLVLSTGLALVAWAGRRPTPLDHEQQALRIAAQQAADRARDRFRYGIAQ